MTPPRPLVSVLLPPAQNPALISRSVASVAAQSLLGHPAPAPRVEVLVAGEALPALPASAPPALEVRAIPVDSSRAACATNTLLEAASGDAVAWLEPGDAMAPERLAESWEHLDADPSLGGIFSFASFPSTAAGAEDPLSAALNVERDPEELAHRMLLGNVLATSSAMLRGSLLTSLGPRPLDEGLMVAHAYDLWCRLLLEAPLKVVPRPLAICALAEAAPVGERQSAHESWKVATRHAGAIMRRWPTLPQTNYAFFSRVADLAYRAGDYQVTIDYLNLKRQSFGHDDDDCLQLVDCLVRQKRLPQAVALLKVLHDERRRLAPSTFEQVTEALKRLEGAPPPTGGVAPRPSAHA